MSRGVPEHWWMSVVCAPLAVLVGATLLASSPFIGALVLTTPALAMALCLAGAPVVASYLLGVSAASASLVVSGLPYGEGNQVLVSPPSMLAASIAVAVTLTSQLFFRERVRLWTATLSLSLVCTGGLLGLELLRGAVPFEAHVEAAPEVLLSVPACAKTCAPHATPGGHLRCSNVTTSERVVAVRECDAASGFMHVRSEGRETSVLLERDLPAVVWRDASGRLLVEQAGTPMRALSPTGAVLLSSSLAPWSPRQPAHLLELAGASLLVVGAALVLVLLSHREQRLLSAALVGHVEAGRFFPRDRQLVPVQVAGAWRNGPALLLGVARRASYRDGGGDPMRVVSGTGCELAARHATRRLGAWALALGVVLFATMSVAADLARLQ